LSSPLPTAADAGGESAWAHTPLGAPEGWSPALRSAVDLVRTAPLPLALLWGERLLQVCNPAFAHALGAPPAQGHGALEVEGGPWEPLRVALQAVRRTGVPAAGVRLPLPGGLRLRLGLSALRDERGAVAGVLASAAAPHRAHEDEGGGEAEDAEALQELREGAARYRLLFEGNPLPAWLYDVETLGFLEVNEAAVARYGYSREEFLRMSLRDVFPPEDVAHLGTTLAREVAVHTGVYRHRLRDGSFVWMEASEHTMRLGGRRARLVVLNDVTERHASEARERRAHAQLATLVQSAPVAIVAVDLHYRVTAWNAAAERLFGWRAEEVLGEPVPIIPAEALPGVERMWRELEEGRREPVQGREARRRRRDGSDVDVLLSTALLRDVAGAVVGRMVFFVDLTEQKRLEEQVRQSQKMEAVGQLAGGIAHDFNNLLTIICSHTQLALEALEPSRSLSQVHEDVEEIGRAAARATALTRQLLAFSRRQVLRLEEVDLNRLVQDVERMLRRLIRADIHIRLALDEALGPVHADRGQIEQVLLNLAVNARDAMPAGGTLTLRTRALPTAAQLCVEDTGQGMDEATRRRIFEPFFTTKPVGQGTGLGLATVYGILKQLGGSIDVESAPGQGARFTLLLPRAAPPAATAAPEPVAPPEAGREEALEDERQAEGTSVRLPRGSEALLLVEDEDGVRASVRRLLERQGYRVREARSGLEALRLLEAQWAAADGSPPVQLVLTDLVMPELGGRELVQRLRARWPTLRALFMSGYDRDVSAGAGLHDPLLHKPFATELLLRRVREALDGPPRPPHTG
jgi:PAS domain S-box-containing protein